VPPSLPQQGFRGRGGTTTQRLDGAIYAASNAALMLAQLGEEEGALKEVRERTGFSRAQILSA
jgi:hypothetical protein